MLDPYVYPNTEVLINKLDIKKIDILNQAEADFTATRIKELSNYFLEGCFDYEHLLKVHAYIFQDIFDWAGKSRKINIEKPEYILKGLSVEYADYSKIEEEINVKLIELNAINFSNLSIEERADKFAKILSDLWKAHPFREGNTRTILAFIYLFADARRLKLNKVLLSENSEYLRNALVASAFSTDDGIERNYSYLKRILEDALK